MNPAAGSRPGARRRLPLLLLAACYAVLLAAWVVTNPPGAAPDEVNHYVRALAVGRGDIVGRPNPELADPAVARPLPKSSGADALRGSWAARGARLVRVPAGLGPPDGFGCEAFDPTKTSRCQEGSRADPQAADRLTTMGTVEPLPYLLPGLATRLAGGPEAGLLLARAAGALVVALLLGATLALLWSWSDVAVAGLVVAVTPMAVFVGSALSGSGMEVAAAVCFFAAAVRIALGPEGGRAAWVAAGASGAALASSRSLGPVWILIGVAGVVGAAGVGTVWGRVRAAGRWAAGAGTTVAVATGCTVAWEVAYQPGVDFDAALFGRQLGPSVGSLGGAGREAVGVFGSLDSHLPGVAYAAWAVLVVALVVLALVVGTGRQRAVLAVLVPAVAGIAVLVSAGIMGQNGFGLQGRHVLPLATLVPVLAGGVVAANQAALGQLWQRWALGAFAVPAVLVQGVAWYVNARRYSVGADGPVVLFGASEWAPPGGWVAWAVVVAMAVVAGVAGALVAGRAAAVASPDQPLGARAGDRLRRRRPVIVAGARSIGHGVRSVPRRHKLVLGAIVAVGLLRGLFWVSVTLVFNPIDEAPHYAYVESMAERLRPPVVGTDRLSPEAMTLLKRTATSYWRSVPFPPDPDDERWQAVAESYEGVQGPTYYALMALPYRLAQPFGALSAVYAVRVASVLLSLLAVPITYLLARELFSRRSEVWLAAPAVLVALQGFNANLASITNDALVVPLGGAVLLAAARLRRTGFTGWNGLVTGALLGLALATKSNMIALFPVVGVWALCVARARRDGWSSLLRWCAAAAATGLATAGPWLAWNLAQYGSLSADDEVDRITGPLQPKIPRTFAGLRRHLRDATAGFWDSQLAGRQLGRYMWVVSLVAVALLVAAIAVSLLRRRRQEAAALAWLGSAVFVTLGAMLFVIFAVFAGRSSVVGRHLYPGLVATVVVVAAAAFVVAGRRGGWLVLAALAALTTTFEVDTIRRQVDLVYVDGLIGPLAPVVEQTWAVGRVNTPVVRVAPPCPAEAFALGLATPAPASLSVATAAGTVQAARTGEQTDQPEPLTTYALPSPTTAPFEVALPGVALRASADDRDPRLSMEGEPGDPVARIFCPVASPAAFRFEQRFTPDHPSWMGYDAVRAWPVVWAWAARVGLGAVVIAFVLQGRRARARARSGPRTAQSVRLARWRTSSSSSPR